MKYLTVALLSVLLVACGGGAKAQLIKKLYENRVSNVNSGTILPAGTLISWGCDGYSRLNEVADGQGGSTTETVDRSPDCGWNPPEAGTVSETRCEDPYTLVTVFNDGEYGFYEEEEEKSEECGYVPPQVEPVKETGDRFDPVVFNYESLLDEQPTLEVTLGQVSFEDGQILIRGAGATGEGTLVLEGTDEYRYTIVEEPRCAKQEDTFYDCQGYFYTGAERGYIYYGDGDDRIVEWELGVAIYTDEDSLEAADNSVQKTGWVTLYEKGSPAWNSIQADVDKYNEAYERSGINVRFVLKEGYVGTMNYLGVSGIASLARVRGYEIDILLGMGNVCVDTCGCAFVNERFSENSNEPLSSTSRCGWDTDVHEIGHSIGLAHGPENRSNEASGYIWPSFGHGWEALFCFPFADIMSYETNTPAHHNSTLTCDQMYGDLSFGRYSDGEAPGGSRDFADAAYHVNRVRYDVSLIHCEDPYCAESPEQAVTMEIPELVETRPLIEDKLKNYSDGEERVRRGESRILQLLNSKTRNEVLK